MTAKFVIDTNVIVDVWEHRYPPDLFPGVRREALRHMTSGHIVSPNEVKKELQRQKPHDGASACLTDLAGVDQFFLEETAEIQAKLQEVLRSSWVPRNWARRLQNRPAFADPWVVAAAAAHSLAVLSDDGEVRKVASNHLGLEVMTFVQFMRAHEPARWSSPT